MIGSNVVNVTFHRLGLMLIDTPKICKVLVKVEAPGWLVVIVMGSKKSRLRAAIMPVL
jgi:hypothetical protein